MTSTALALTVFTVSACLAVIAWQLIELREQKQHDQDMRKRLKYMEAKNRQTLRDAEELREVIASPIEKAERAREISIQVKRQKREARQRKAGK